MNIINEFKIEFVPAKTWMYGVFGPATVYLKNGLRHRDNDLPAVECDNGSKEWWVNGQLHRDNDLPAIEYITGRKEWWVNGTHIKVIN